MYSSSRSNWELREFSEMFGRVVNGSEIDLRGIGGG